MLIGVNFYIWRINEILSQVLIHVVLNHTNWIDVDDLDIQYTIEHFLSLTTTLSFININPLGKKIMIKINLLTFWRME